MPLLISKYFLIKIDPNALSIPDEHSDKFIEEKYSIFVQAAISIILDQSKRITARFMLEWDIGRTKTWVATNANSGATQLFKSTYLMK